MNGHTVRKFRLSDKFISQYEDKKVPWGPVGYVTYKRTYARRLDERDTRRSGNRRMVPNLPKSN